MVGDKEETRAGGARTMRKLCELKTELNESCQGGSPTKSIRRLYIEEIA
jgi:hypothetical protein